MLNTNLKPSQFTRASFERHVDALQAALADHFDFTTKKRGKLRDVAVKTMFGLENGYQQAIPSFASDLSRIPEPIKRRRLPKEVMVYTGGDLEEVVLLDPANQHASNLHTGSTLYAVRDPLGEWEGLSEAEAKGVSDEDFDLSESDLLRQLHHDFELASFTVHMPSTAKYGLSPLVQAQHARELLQELLIDTDHLDDDALSSLIEGVDTQDDAGGSVRIIMTAID